MELLTVGELARTVMRGEDPPKDLSVQVANKSSSVNIHLSIPIGFLTRC